MKNTYSFFLLVFLLTSIPFVSSAQDTFDISFKDTSLLNLKYDTKCEAYTTSKDELLDLNLDLKWLSESSDSVFQDFCVVQLKNQKTHFYTRIDKIKFDYEKQLSLIRQDNLKLENDKLTLEAKLKDLKFKNRVVLITSFVILSTIITHAYIF